MWIFRNQVIIFRTAEFLDHILAGLRRHAERYILDCRPWIKIAFVVGQRLLLRLEQISHQIQYHFEFLCRQSLGHHHVLGIVNPSHVLERAHLEIFRNHAQRPWIDIPSGDRHRHVARTFAQLFHHRAGTARIIFNAAIEIFQIGPGLAPAIDRIFRILVVQQIRQSHQESTGRSRIGGTRVNQTIRIGLAPGQQFGRAGWHLLDFVRVVFEQRSGRHEHHCQRLIQRQFLHLARRRQVIFHHAGKFGRIVRQHFDPEFLFYAGSKNVGAAQYQINVAAIGRLHRAQLARQFRGGGFGEGEFDVGMRDLVAFYRVLQQRQRTGNVDYIDRDGLLGMGRQTDADACSDGRERGDYCDFVRQTPG